MTHRTEIDNTVQHITVSLTKSFEDACPLTVIGTKPQGWSKKLERLKCKVRKLFNRAMNTCNDADWDNHKKAQAEYKKGLRRSSRHRWKGFCTSIESNTTLRKVLAAEPNHEIGSLKIEDGTYTKTVAETHELLLKTHFPDCTMCDGAEWRDPISAIPSEAD